MFEGRNLREADGCLGCPVRRHGFCGNLPDHVQSRLAQHARQTDYTAGHTFWGEDEQVNFVGILRRGHLRLQRHSIEGQRRILTMVTPGEMVGDVVETRTHCALEASTNVSLCRIGTAAFLRLMDEERDLRRAVVKTCMDRLDAIRQKAWKIGLLSAEERICEYLVRACEVMPYQPQPDGSGVLTLQIPRADIADLLGTTKESFSRVSHRLQRAGIIEIWDPIHIRICDLARLAQMGGVALSPVEGISPKPPPMIALPQHPKLHAVMATDRPVEINAHSG